MSSPATDTTDTATAAPLWLDALDNSSQNIQTLVADLSVDQLRGLSFAAPWTIAQVLS